MDAKRLLHWLHEFGAILGILTTVVALASESAHLLSSDMAVKVAAAGVVLASMGRALKTIEKQLAEEYPDSIPPDTKRKVAAEKSAESPEPPVP